MSTVGEKNGWSEAVNFGYKSGQGGYDYNLKKEEFTDVTLVYKGGTQGGEMEGTW